VAKEVSQQRKRRQWQSPNTNYSCASYCPAEYHFTTHEKIGDFTMKFAIKVLSFFLLLCFIPFITYSKSEISSETLPYEISVQDSEYCSTGNIRTFDFSSTGELLITVASTANIFSSKRTYYVNFYDSNNIWRTTFRIEAMGYLAAHFNEQDEIELYLDRNSQMFVIDSSGALISKKNRDIDVMEVQKSFIEKDGIAYYRDAIGKEISYTVSGNKYSLFKLSVSWLNNLLVILPLLLLFFASGLFIIFVHKKNNPK